MHIRTHRSQLLGSCLWCDRVADSRTHGQSKPHLQPYTYHTVTCISNPTHWLLLPHFIRLQCLPLSYSKQIEEWPGICSYLLLCSLFSQLHSPNLFSPSCRPKNSTLESSYTRQNQYKIFRIFKRVLEAVAQNPYST